MAASTVQTVSKPSKKKVANAKIVERNESPAPSTASSPADKLAESQDDFESPYIKELHKNIRNANKKLANAQKTDTILAQHPGKSLDDLVAERIINADQKAQISKKPALLAQIAQYEEQLQQYQKVHEQYQAKATADKLEWEKSSEKEKADAVSTAKAEFQASLGENLLVLSQFLRLAAYRREEAKDPESDESQAIEGVLLAIYSGDDSAVSSMMKLIQGSDDQIVSVPGEQLQTTYAAVNNLAKTYQAPQFGEAAQAPETQEAEAAADPTIQHEAATELEAGDGPLTLTNGHAHEEPATNGITNSSVSDDAANAAAESQWDSSATKDETSISQEWVKVSVPQESSEAEPAAEAAEATNVAVAAEANKQSWADDHPEAAPASTEANDGFHQIQRNRGRQDREGGNGGRGRGRGEWRGGRGHRGDGRGRGRGGNRGGAGGPSRGPRRAEES